MDIHHCRAILAFAMLLQVQWLLTSVPHQQDIDLKSSGKELGIWDQIKRQLPFSPVVLRDFAMTLETPPEIKEAVNLSVACWGLSPSTLGGSAPKQTFPEPVLSVGHLMSFWAPWEVGSPGTPQWGCPRSSTTPETELAPCKHYRVHGQAKG